MSILEIQKLFIVFNFYPLNITMNTHIQNITERPVKNDQHILFKPNI